jgi:hypothetical protein
LLWKLESLQRASRQTVMTTEAVVFSFARAIEHHHVLEDSSEGIAEHVIASSDLSTAKEHRELVQQMIQNLDNEIEKVSVRDRDSGGIC